MVSEDTRDDGLPSDLGGFNGFLYIKYHGAAVSLPVKHKRLKKKKKKHTPQLHFDLPSFCAVTFSSNGLSHPDLPTQTF